MTTVIGSHFVDFFLSPVVRKKRGYLWLLRRRGDYVSHLPTACCCCCCCCPAPIEPVSQCLPFAVCFSKGCLLACASNHRSGVCYVRKDRCASNCAVAFALGITRHVYVSFSCSLTSAKLRTDTEQRREMKNPPLTVGNAAHTVPGYRHDFLLLYCKQYCAGRPRL